MKSNQRTRPDDGDAIALLREQHREMDQMLAVLGREGVPVPPTAAVTELADLCAVHLAIEDRLFHPSIGLHEIDDHSDLKRYLGGLLEADLTGRPIDAIARNLRSEVREHATQQERRTFPLARRRLDAVRLRRLGYEMRVLEFELRTDVSPRLLILSPAALPASTSPS